MGSIKKYVCPYAQPLTSVNSILDAFEKSNKNPFLIWNVPCDDVVILFINCKWWVYRCLTVENDEIEKVYHRNLRTDRGHIMVSQNTGWYPN